MNADDEDLEPPPGFGEQEDFWDRCELTRIMTDPPSYELKLPSGHVLQLRSSHFFKVASFTQAFVDATATFPPLPQKGAGAFLLDVFQRLLESRKDIEMVSEAGEFGTICGDIKLAILACPVSDDPIDIDRGAIFPAPDAEAAGGWLNARCLLARVQRACPVKVTPSGFYLALNRLGLRHLGPKRAGGWQGRVWFVPPALLPHALKSNGAAQTNLLGMAHTKTEEVN
jgi:hypothetical protein